MRKLLLALGAILAAVILMVFAPVYAQAEEEGGLAITAQPEDVDVNYPDGAEFHVEVSDPDLVESYQWIYNDGTQDFVLTGSSAYTDTLIIPSSDQDSHDAYLRCVIKDKDGNEIESNAGCMHVANADEFKTVLYINDQAIEPGESLDMEEAGFGSGIISFDEDGINITLDNVDISTENVQFDHQLSAGLPLFLTRRHNENLEYYINLVGDNVLTDTFYDEEYHSGGVVLNTFFATQEDEDPPTVFIQGDGTLTLNGGTNGIYSLANIEIDSNLTVQPNGDIYSDAITCLNLFVGENARLDLTCNGGAIRAKADVRIAPNAVLDLKSYAPRVAVGATVKTIFYVDGSIYADGAVIYVKGVADPERFVPYEAALANYNAISFGGNLNMNETVLSIDLSILPSDEPYVYSLYGISADGEFSAIDLAGKSRLTVNMDADSVPTAAAVVISGLITADEDCVINIKASSCGETLGIEADRSFDLTDMTMSVKVSSVDETMKTYGIVGGGFNYTLNKDGYYVYCRAENGAAMLMDTGEYGDFEVEPEEDYEAEKILLSENVKSMYPAECVINLFGAPGYGTTIRAEALYDPADMTNPASEILLTNSELLNSVLAWLNANYPEITGTFFH